MTPSEAILVLTNARDARDRYAAADDEAAYMYEAAANADGVGHERRGFALDTALRFAERAKKSRRLSEALTVAIAHLPAIELTKELA